VESQAFPMGYGRRRIEKDSYWRSGALHWSSSRTKRIAAGDRIFLRVAGQHPTGTIASGYARSRSVPGPHWKNPAELTNYNDTILTRDRVMPTEDLSEGPLSKVHWQHQSGGLSIHDAAASLLEEKWSDYLDRIGFGPPERRFDASSAVWLYSKKIGLK
jgi:hypothetical protein